VIADPTIIGRVSDENGNPLAGATVDLTGSLAATTTTDANGAYTFGLLSFGGSYTVSVVAPGYIFGSAGVINLQKNVRRDFGPAIVSIGGQVTLGAGGLSATTMTLSVGKSLVVPTDGAGNYSLTNLPAGRDYTVTPTKAGFGFAPTSRSFTNLLADASAANFVATSSVGEASHAGTMTATKGAGTSINVSYTASCGSLGHVVYRGAGPIVSALAWNASYCGYDTSGALNFDPGTPPPSSFWYFVVVGHSATTEGSYGKSSAGAQEPEAIGIGACDLPQNVTASCP
jgi:hypothetical protein